MIKSLTLNNFRAFRHASIEFAPITILAGANSSGKSSVIQAINGILQSRNERHFPFDFVLNGDLTKLGGFRNVVHGHNAKNSFRVAIEFKQNDKTYLADATFKVDDESRHLFPREILLRSSDIGSLHVTWNQKKQRFKLNMQRANQTHLPERTVFEMFVELVNSDPKGGSDLVSRVVDENRKVNLDIAKAIIEERLELAKNGVESSSNDFGSALNEFATTPLFENIRKDFFSAFEALRRTVANVGPIRAYPARYYTIGRQFVVSDPMGESASHALAVWKEEKNQKFQSVKDALVQLELATDVNAVVELDEFLKLLIKPKGRAYPDTIADVGFGVSQALPMLVADAALVKGGTLVVNQPEIHLHPSSQALLGNYFADRINSRRYVIETHSEYLITRLRLLIATGRLTEDDVAIYYCSGTGIGSEVTRIFPRKNGKLDAAPPEFFTTYAADTFQLAMSVMEREEELQDAAE